MIKYDYLIVGAGLSGSVIAERLASQLNKKVLIIDRRNHIGGNCYDCYNMDGVLIHKYGAHLFHTKYKSVFDYLSNFTKWHKYEHRVKSYIDDEIYDMPINLNTINKFDRSITVHEEIRTLGDGSQGEVESIYIGLGAAYYGTRSGDDAGYRQADSSGWQWISQPELSPAIADVIAIANNSTQEARFIALPVELKK